MNRAEFEAYYAKMHGRTVQQMREVGYVSAPCPCEVDGCPGWQAIAIPEDANPRERKQLLNGLINNTIKKFGEE